MAEYIDREKLTNALDELCDRVCAYTPVQRQFMCGSCSLGCAIEMFEDFPSADVQPVKHGEWTAEGNDEKGNYWDECTVCRDAVWFPPFVKNDYKYCPHCGAKMDGEEDG